MSDNHQQQTTDGTRTDDHTRPTTETRLTPPSDDPFDDDAVTSVLDAAWNDIT